MYLQNQILINYTKQGVAVNTLVPRVSLNSNIQQPLTFGTVFSKNSLFQKELKFGACSKSTGC